MSKLKVPALAKFPVLEIPAQSVECVDDICRLLAQYGHLKWCRSLREQNSSIAHQLPPHVIRTVRLPVNRTGHKVLRRTGVTKLLRTVSVLRVNAVQVQSIS